MTKTWQRAGKSAAGILIAAVLLIGFMELRGDIGVSASKLEADVRRGQHIDSSWVTEGEVSEEMAAYISYPPDRTDHTYSIYVNRPGWSFGYFFRCGGDLVETEKYITEYRLDGYNERVFISMNQQKAAYYTYDGADSMQTAELDSTKPFAFVLPVGAGNVVFYDEAGTVLETNQRGM